MYRQFHGHNLSAHCYCKPALDDVKTTYSNAPYIEKETRDLIDSINSLTLFPPNLNELLINPRVFPRPFRHGGFVPPPPRQVHGDKVLMGGLMRGDIDIMGGPNFDRLYHKLKVPSVIFIVFTVMLLILL